MYQPLKTFINLTPEQQIVEAIRSFLNLDSLYESKTAQERNIIGNRKPLTREQKDRNNKRRQEYRKKNELLPA